MPVAQRRKVSNLLALALLSLLSVREPMYPYEMAQTLRLRGKEQSIKINWGSLYTVVRNLEKHGFIEAVGTDREGRQPERTTYRITELGLAELRDWLRELISIPEEEPSRFEAAIANWGILSPDEVVSLLRERADSLDKLAAGLEATLGVLMRHLPRVFLVELEYQLAMRKAEAGWVRGLLPDILSGALGDVDAWRRFSETGEVPQQVRELEEQARRGWPEPEESN